MPSHPLLAAFLHTFRMTDILEDMPLQKELRISRGTKLIKVAYLRSLLSMYRRQKTTLKKKGTPPAPPCGSRRYSACFGTPEGG